MKDMIFEIKNSVPVIIQVGFKHPEYGTKGYLLVWAEPLYEDYTYDEVCDYIWNTYNKYNIYHEMSVTFNYIIENKLVTHKTITRGCAE